MLLFTFFQQSGYILNMKLLFQVAIINRPFLCSPINNCCFFLQLTDKYTDDLGWFNKKSI